MKSRSGKPETRKALGRGIQALLGSRPAESAPSRGGGVREIPIDHIQPNPNQPRRAFHPDRLNELAASIGASGVVQPILVRPAGNRFELVAGERRWRAARIAGLATIPAIVQEVANNRLLEIALIENIQREDLNPIETAQAFEQLSRDLALTQEQIAQKTGKDRATISNFMRLLKLAAEVQAMLAEGTLTMGHAKALAGFDLVAQRALARRIVAQGLSVRAVEKIAKEAQEPAKPKPAPSPVDPNTRAAIQEMERTLGTRVRVVEGKRGAGRIEIEYYNPGDLQRLYKHLVGDDGDNDGED
jgi:ParB family chromosome partitioning protein